MKKDELGRQGESLASEFLERKGYRVIGRNFRAGRCEIDLIARREDLLVFVEVKTRGSLLFGHPACAVTRAKRKHITGVARSFIERNRLHHLRSRFDVIAILMVGEKASIVHIEDAFRPFSAT